MYGQIVRDVLRLNVSSHSVSASCVSDSHSSVFRLDKDPGLVSDRRGLQEQVLKKMFLKCSLCLQILAVLDAQFGPQSLSPLDC